MAYTILSGRTKDELLDKLNGVLDSKVNLHSGADVTGLTLVFTSPAAITVTFSDPNKVTLAQIVAEINAAAGLSGVASIKTVQMGHIKDRRLQLVDPAGASVALTIGTSTGAALLGFDSQNATGTPIAFSRINGGIGQDISSHYFVLVAP